MYTFSELVLEDTINFEMKDISSKRNHFSIIKQTNEMSNWYLNTSYTKSILALKALVPMAWFLK